MQQFDLVVIGGGSAGLKAARIAARAGHRVAVAEEEQLGGECFWAGCVPTKAMIRAAEVWHLVRRASEFGIYPEIQKADFAAAMDYQRRVIRQVEGEGPEDAGLSMLGVAYFPGHATFEGPHEVHIGEEVIHGERIILATGTVPAIPPIPGLQDAGYITNREAITLDALPKRLVVLGAGPIGLEFAQVFRRFGSEVTVLEIGATILPREDPDIAALSAEYLREEGVRILTGVHVERITSDPSEKRVFAQTAEAMETIPCDEILVAAGRKAAVGSLNLEATGLKLTGNYLSVDAFLRTDVPHIFAPGDINGSYLFTHVASYQGRLAAHNAFAETLEPADLRVVPRGTFIDPEVASVGMTEPEAIKEHGRIAVHSFSFNYSDRAILHGDARGLVKLIADAQDEQILGGHILGPYASSLLAEVAIAMQHRLPIKAIAATMHAYPTFPEAIESAALSPPVFRG